MDPTAANRLKNRLLQSCGRTKRTALIYFQFLITLLFHYFLATHGRISPNSESARRRLQSPPRGASQRSPASDVFRVSSLHFQQGPSFSDVVWRRAAALRAADNAGVADRDSVGQTSALSICRLDALFGKSRRRGPSDAFQSDGAIILSAFGKHAAAATVKRFLNSRQRCDG